MNKATEVPRLKELVVTEATVSLSHTRAQHDVREPALVSVYSA